MADDRSWLKVGGALRADVSSVARLALQRWQEKQALVTSFDPDAGS